MEKKEIKLNKNSINKITIRNKTIIKNIIFDYLVNAKKLFALFISLLLMSIPASADLWTSSQPSHGTLYADTITSKTDASSVTVADAQGFIVTTGNVGIGTTTIPNILTIVQTSLTDPIADAWTVYSSRRWKTNITAIDNALGKVMQLQGVNFNWKADNKHDIGMIAEDVGKIIPEVIAYEENGKDAKSLDYAKLTTILVEAVKELKAENDALKQRVEILESKN